MSCSICLRVCQFAQPSFSLVLSVSFLVYCGRTCTSLCNTLLCQSCLVGHVPADLDGAPWWWEDSYLWAPAEPL